MSTTTTTTMVTARNPFYGTYLLPDVARQTRSKSALGKEKTTEPKTKLRSDSDQLEHTLAGSSVVEGIQTTISEPPPAGRLEDKNQTSTPATRAPQQSDLLLRRFNSSNIKISPSGRRTCMKILQFISDHSAECAVFSAVKPGEYAKLIEFIDHFGVKTRLTYDQKERSLLVEMPSAIHEAPMAAVQCAFLKFFTALPFPKRLVNTNVLTGITSKKSIPDLRISLQNVADYRFSLIVTGWGETAFSQGVRPMYRKLRTAIKVNPSLLLVMAAVVDETHQYHAPRPGSVAWNTLLFEPTIRSQGDFIAGVGVTRPALDRPLVVEGHTWASLGEVRLKAWIRPGDVDVDDHTIDMSTNDPDKVAEGIFYPTNNMDDVLAIIERGANMIRERLIILCQDIQPNIDIRPLQDPNIAFHFDLDDLHTKLVGAMGETAYERYEDWYTKAPRPRITKRKRNADALEPVSSGTRSKKKRQRVVGAAKRKRY
ncbi:hypothetical protein EDD22DRAFT_955979 [Suillus occidentalis]|nr:hypothetical protein EDD22DRAFT_955979 [Suillus occidentalis]